MKAVVLNQYGSVRNIEVREVARPKAKSHEVLVEVYAAGTNPLDIKVLSGKMKAMLKLPVPFVMGTDFSGRVVEIGKGVTKFKVGDEVFGNVSSSLMGAFAEFVTIKEEQLALKPKNITFDEAASLPLVGLTVYQSLVGIAQLKSGQKVFIKAGSGGIGSFGVQFAKAMGASVATTTSTQNIEWVKNLGADQVVDYKKEKFQEVLKDYDIVLNTVDGEPIEDSFQVLRKGGHLISLVGPVDGKFAKKMGLNLILQLILGFMGRKANFLARKNGVHYEFLFVRPSGSELEKIKDLVEQNKIKPVIDRVFNIDEAREALAHQESGRAKGKIILKIKG